MAVIDDIRGWQDEFVRIRRDIHAHPEIAYEEERTSDLVAAKLAEWGVEVHRGLAGTGVVGTIHGTRGEGRTIGLRADMDALPMQEKNHFAHASVNPGKMHACGHDGHTTMLLAGTRYLAEHPDFPGTVRVIFQPAEEDRPGAEQMIKEGLFEQFPMDAVFGMHNRPGMPVGRFGVKSGPVMASSCWFAITVRGQGGHAAEPNLVRDPIVAAGQLTSALQSIVSRSCAPQDRVVVSITQIHGGSADNVIPDEVVLRGTIRSFSESVQALVIDRMEQLAQSVSAAFGCTADCEVVNDYPLVFNDPEQTDVCDRVLANIFGDASVDRDIVPEMGGEDFAFMLQQRPGCYVWIGNGDGGHRADGHGEGPCGLHNACYDFNDEAIPVGATYWVELARQWLAR